MKKQRKSRICTRKRRHSLFTRRRLVILNHRHSYLILPVRRSSRGQLIRLRKRNEDHLARLTKRLRVEETERERWLCLCVYSKWLPEKERKRWRRNDNVNWKLDDFSHAHRSMMMMMMLMKEQMHLSNANCWFSLCISVWSTATRRKSRQRIRRITSMSFDIETNWIHLFISHLLSRQSRGEANANHWSAPPIIAEETKSTNERRRRRILLIQMNVRRMKTRSSPFWEERKRRWSA